MAHLCISNTSHRGRGMLQWSSYYWNHINEH